LSTSLKDLQQRALFSWLKSSKNFATFQPSPSHLIKYTKRHMFEVVNVGKKLTNHTRAESFESALFVRLISHQPAVLFSQNKSATSNQPAVFFSQNKPAPAISHQPNEQATS
jgi:hypothetical protein